MAFNKDIAPDQLGKGQSRLQGVNTAMKQGSNSGEHMRGLFKAMKQGSMSNDKPNGREFIGRGMKQGGPGSK
jgi:hypothetical protein